MKYLKTVVEMMAVAARTAPKSAGQDYVRIEIVEKPKLQLLAKAMIQHGEKTGKANYDRDADNIKHSDFLLLIGIKDAQPLGMNCGTCGQAKCADLPKPKEGPEFKGPYCAYRMVDLGIAISSAAKTASMFNADNRIMYRAGVIARQIELIDADVCIGIPISATGKSIYFDRK
ncbi:MAG: hypothetical protein KAS70_05455 [Planctomycetes bacterium]|nr:hypothetical protein [Planctomycetota bacterium]